MKHALHALAFSALALFAGNPAQAVTTVNCANSSKSIEFSLGADSPWEVDMATCDEGNVSGTDTAVIGTLFGGSWTEGSGLVGWNTQPSTTSDSGLVDWEYEFVGDIYPFVTIVLKQADFFAAFRIALDLFAIPPGTTSLSPIVTGTWRVLQYNQHGTPTSENTLSHSEIFVSGVPFDPTSIRVPGVPVPLGLPLIASAFGVAWLVRRRAA